MLRAPLARGAFAMAALRGREPIHSRVSWMDGILRDHGQIAVHGA